MDEQVSRIKVDLENASQAQQQIENLNKNVKEITVNMEHLEQAFKDAPNVINQFIKTLDKVNNKGHLEGSVTARDKNIMDVRTNDLNDVLNKVVQVSSGATIVNDKNGEAISSNQQTELQQQAEAILRMVGSQGINPNIASVNGRISDVQVDAGSNGLKSAYSQQTRDSAKRADFSAVDEFKDLDSILKQNKDIIREANSNISNSRRTVSNIGATVNTGKVTFNRNQQYESFFKTKDEQLSDSYDKIIGRRDTLVGKRTALNNAEEFYKDERKNATTSEDLNKIDKQIASIQALRDKVDANIDKLEEVSTNISNERKKVSDTQENYNNAQENGSLEVGVDPNSFRGRLRSQSMNIAQRTVATGEAVLGGAMTGGTATRINAYNQGTGSIMLGLANNGITGKKMDDRILQNLQEVGLHNGTHYTGTEMVQFANAYTSTNRTGNIKDYQRQADAISQMARYSGLSDQSATSLIQQAGLSGVTNMVNLSRTFSGALQQSNMLGRSNEMASALGQIYANSANIGDMTSTQAGRIAAFQGIMNGTHHSELQGQQGANAFNAMTNGITDTHNMYARQLFAQSTGNPSQYGGQGGAFKLSLAMEQARKDPTKLKGVLDTLNRNSSGNEYLMAQQLQDIAPNLSATQAKDLVSLYQKGDFSKSKIDKVMHEDERKGKNNKSGKEAYSSSGKSTLDFSIAVDEKGNVKISKATDHLRGLKANLNNAIGPIGGVLFDSAATFGGNVLGTALAGMFSSHFSGKGGGMLSRIGSRFGKGGSAGSAGAEVAEDVAEGATKEGKGGFFKNIAENVASGYVQDKIFRGIGKVGKAGKGLFTRGVSKVKGTLGKVKGKLKPSDTDLEVMSEDGSRLLDNAGKIGKGNAFMSAIPGLFQGFGGLIHHNGRKAATGFGSAAGGAGGSLAGAAVGSLFGPVGTLIGGAVGGLAGDWLGGKAGKGIHDFFSKHSKSSKSQKKKSKDINKHTETYVSKQKGLIRQFNAMLDKAGKIIAEAKSVNGSDGSDGSGKSSGDVGSDSNKGKNSAAAWKSDILKAAKAMGQNISDGEVNKLIGLIQAESGGNADIGKGIDDHDGTGRPLGLLQYKVSTFNKYKVANHGDINNGYDQLLAFFNNSNWEADLDRNGGGPGGWGPTGSVLHSHATGGLFATTAIHGNHIIGEQGLEAAIPLNGQHYNDGKRTIKSLAGAFGMSVVDHTSSVQAQSQSKKINVTPRYNLSINLSGTEDVQDVQNEVRNQLESTLDNRNQELLNYYSQTISSI